MTLKGNACMMSSLLLFILWIEVKRFKGYQPGWQDGTDILFGQLKLVKIKVSQNRPMGTLSHTLTMLNLQDATAIDCQ